MASLKDRRKQFRYDQLTIMPANPRIVQEGGGEILPAHRNQGMRILDYVRRMRALTGLDYYFRSVTLEDGTAVHVSSAYEHDHRIVIVPPAREQASTAPQRESVPDNPLVPARIKIVKHSGTPLRPADMILASTGYSGVTAAFKLYFQEGARLCQYVPALPSTPERDVAYVAFDADTDEWLFDWRGCAPGWWSLSPYPPNPTPAIIKFCGFRDIYDDSDFELYQGIRTVDIASNPYSVLNTDNQYKMRSYLLSYKYRENTVDSLERQDETDNIWFTVKRGWDWYGHQSTGDLYQANVWTDDAGEHEYASDEDVWILPGDSLTMYLQEYVEWEGNFPLRWYDSKAQSDTTTGFNSLRYISTDTDTAKVARYASYINIYFLAVRGGASIGYVMQVDGPSSMVLTRRVPLSPVGLQYSIKEAAYTTTSQIEYQGADIAEVQWTGPGWPTPSTFYTRNFNDEPGAYPDWDFYTNNCCYNIEAGLPDLNYLWFDPQDTAELSVTQSVCLAEIEISVGSTSFVDQTILLSPIDPPSSDTYPMNLNGSFGWSCTQLVGPWAVKNQTGGGPL